MQIYKKSQQLDKNYNLPTIKVLERHSYDYNDDFERDSDKVNVDPDRAGKLLNLWKCRSHKAAKAHYLQALINKRRNLYITTINAMLSILVLFFANATWIDDFLGEKFKIISDLAYVDSEIPITLYTMMASLLAVSLVITTIMQYILRWGESAADHRAAGGEFANLQRKIERYTISRTYNMSMIHNINRDYNHISKSYPLVNTNRWTKAGDGRLSDTITRLENELDNFLNEGPT